mgnify:FL=1
MNDTPVWRNDDLSPANTHYLIVGGLTGLGLFFACILVCNCGFLSRGMKI